MTSVVRPPSPWDVSAAPTRSRRDLVAAKRGAASRLRACRQMSVAVGVVVDALSAAGSGLQRELQWLPKKLAPGDDGDGDLGGDVGGGPPSQRAARDLLGACDDISLTVISLAASLSGDVQKPLEDFQRAVQADCDRRVAQLSLLKREHKSCQGSLADSFDVKERMAAQLQEALAAANDDGSAKTSAFSWVRSLGSGQNVAEARLQQALALQNAAVEDYARHSDKVSELGELIVENAESFEESLGCVDYAMRETLHNTLTGCAKAWEATAASFSTRAQQLRAHAQLVCPSEPLQVRYRPAWLHEHAYVASRVQDAVDNSEVTVRETAQTSDGDSVHSNTDANCAAPNSQVTISLAELEATKEAWKREQEAREIKLLEQEGLLHELQEELQMQKFLIVGQRRSLAIDQARCLAAVEMAAPMPGGKRKTASFLLESPAKGFHDDREDADDVWDMDWADLPVTRLHSDETLGETASPSSQSPSKSTANVDESVLSSSTPRSGGFVTDSIAARTEGDGCGNGTKAAPETCGSDSATACTVPSTANISPLEQLALGRERSASVGSTDLRPCVDAGDIETLRRKLEEKRELAERHNGENHTTGLSTQRIPNVRTPGKAGAMSEPLRRKLEEKRELAERHNGEDHTTVPSRQRPPQARMGGEMADKLEARRRLIEAAEANDGNGGFGAPTPSSAQ